MIKGIFTSLLVVLSVAPAFAENASKLLSEWGGGDWAWCGSHAFESSEACIGATKSCKIKSMYARNWTDEYAFHMMVALEINEHGAKFCPIQIEGKNKNKKNAWTEYAQIGDTTKCKWLCKDGWSGENCATAQSDVKTCNTVEFKRSDYDNLKRQASGANIESSIAWFNWARDNGCGLNKSQEHDSILIITRWAPGGHGAWVQPVIVRAQREGWKNMISWPVVYPRAGSSEVLACIDGYMPNTNRTDCVPIDPNVCAAARACSGWDTGFDEASYMFVMREGQSCFEYRCKGENMAFVSATDRSCIECPTSLRGGASPVDGTCVKCNSGRVFNNTAKTTSDHCGEAVAYTKTDMQYGKGQTKNSNPDPKNQCWTQTETDVYRECVKAGKVVPITAEDK